MPVSNKSIAANLSNSTAAKYGTVCPQMTKPFSTHLLTIMVMISFLLSLNQSRECIWLHHLFICGNNEQWINTRVCHRVRYIGKRFASKPKTTSAWEHGVLFFS